MKAARRIQCSDSCPESSHQSSYIVLSEKEGNSLWMYLYQIWKFYMTDFQGNFSTWLNQEKFNHMRQENLRMIKNISKEKLLKHRIVVSMSALLVFFSGIIVRLLFLVTWCHLFYHSNNSNFTNMQMQGIGYKIVYQISMTWNVWLSDERRINYAGKRGTLCLRVLFLHTLFTNSIDRNGRRAKWLLGLIHDLDSHYLQTSTCINNKHW